MESVHQLMLKKKLDETDMDEQNKKYYLMAEAICRREYEKAFDFDLNLPIGHPKNRMCRDELPAAIKFWVALGDKYNGTNPLHEAIFFLCTIQSTGMYELYLSLKNTQTD